MRRRWLNKGLLIILVVLTVSILGGCGVEAAKWHKERNARDIMAMIDGEDPDSILERRSSESRNSTTNEAFTIERSGSMRTAADAVMWLENMKFYLIVGIPVSIIIGLIIWFTLGKTSMIFKKAGSFLVIGVPIFCVFLLVVSMFLKGFAA